MMRFLSFLAAAMLAMGSSVCAAPATSADGHPPIKSTPWFAYWALPMPVVGDLPGDPGANVFVYPDAINLNDYVNHDFSLEGEIIWSYEIMGSPGYSINGVPPLGNDSPIFPPLEIQIQLNDLDPAQLDDDPFTITLRDILFSPNDGSTTYTEPGVSGIVNSQLVTLWASDGTSATAVTTIFYTDNDGEDRFSGNFEIVESLDFGTATHGWEYRHVIDGAMTGAQGSGGLCVTTELADFAIEGWVSDPSNHFDLVDHSVYELNFLMSSTSSLGSTPILQFVVCNTAGTDTSGFAYGGEFFMIDQQGSANAITSRPDGEYLWYFAPPQAQVSNWRSASNGAFAPANAGIKNFRMEMIVFDVDGVAQGEIRSGTICLSDLVIRRADIHSVQTRAAVYDIDTGGFTPDNFGVFRPYPYLGSLDPGIVNGNLTATATSSSSLCMLFIEPGPEPFAPDSAHFPIPLVSDQAYMIQWTVASSAGTNPIEIIRLNADTPTNEIIQNAFAAASDAGLGIAALPTMGGPAEIYTGFYYTHSSTLSTGLSAIWRPTLTLANREDVNGALAADNTLTFSSLSVVPFN